MTHRLISYVNSAGIAGSENPDDKQRYQNLDGSFKKPVLDMMELHVIFRETYFNLGVCDKEMRIWKIFNDPELQKLKFEETNRKYIGEVASESSSKN